MNVADSKSMIDFIKRANDDKINIDGINDAIDMRYKPIEIMKFIEYSDIDLYGRITINKGSIQRLYDTTVFTEVPITGIGLGNYKGIYVPIQKDDLVVVGWLDKHTPIILSTINNYLIDNGDNIPPIKADEILITNKQDGDGAVIYFKNNNDIVLKHPNTQGGKLELTKNGVKGNYVSEYNSPGITQTIQFPLYPSGSLTLYFESGLLIDCKLT